MPPLTTTGEDSLTIEAVGPVAIDPEPGLAQGILATLSLLILVAFISSLFKWISLIRQGKRPFGSQPLLEVVSRPRPYWNAVHFIMFYGFVILFSVAMTGIAGMMGYVDLSELTGGETAAADPSSEGESNMVVVELAADDGVVEPKAPTSPPDPAADEIADAVELIPEDVIPSAGDGSQITVPQLLISSFAMLSATLATIFVLRLRRPEILRLPGQEVVGHEQPRFGFVPDRNMIRLGLIGAWLILPPTMLLMGAVSVLQEYSHPVLDALQPTEADGPPNYAVFAALFFTTAIVTPMVEEFWFRGLLQGGLQRLADARTDAINWGLVRINPPVAPMQPTATQHGTDDRNPYQSPPASTDDFIAASPSEMQAIADPATRADWTPTAVWPLIVASLLFALMHWGQGLAPIPLFFLSLGLGYLYRQTGSLVPPIVVHFVLNGFTMSATFLEMMQ
ncbi:CAAX amino terminal protease self- immunity [Neorhodopirellula pilleata]|uniref:CAAX amino terminal protease self-immunity n=2 Tax=Neorhodopirellula pilleata TaxID=2714738 RepID=A0A5C5ZX55_9BACT|nr:type II CAAX endopeptidase family protein [Neorhodopirellula pilleata]TWT92194.1 CAAX amino terminal protease self- immunity [Neorhodopirellula pilleata]